MTSTYPKNQLQDAGITTSRETYKSLRVAVEGNIGAGKSTFLEYCASKNDITTYPEPVALWQNVNGVNLLERFYADPPRWAMQFQLLVGVTILDNYTRRTWKPLKLIERSLLSGQNVFLNHMKRTRIIDETTGYILDKWYENALQSIEAHPHAIVYMRTSPEVAYHRIQQRTRNAENNMTLQYVQNIHQLHETWLTELQVQNMIQDDPILPIYVIDADQGIQNLREDYDRILKQLSVLSLQL